ncbi:MAG: ATP-binding protein [Pseudomonadota bacterium]
MESTFTPTTAAPCDGELVHARKELRVLTPKIETQKAHAQRLESIGILASGVAHELNSPLGIVMSLAHLIMDDDNATEKAQGFAAIIAAESQRMAAIIRELLSFSRHGTETARPVNIKDLVDRTLGLLGSTLQKDRIEVIIRVPEELPQIQCRSLQIQQVLMNLLTNARDASNARFPGASPEKVIRVTASSLKRAGEPWIRLTVEDNGIGIQRELSHRLFEPFFTTKPADQGTGLGLAISRGIIREHGGHLCFESRPDLGARFHMDLRVESAARTIR